MKKILSIIMMATLFIAAVNAQSAAEMALQQQELNKILRKSLDAKPTKDAKKQAKELQKEGWKVPVGERSIEQQITESQFIGAEFMSDENGLPTRRFIQHTGFSTAGTYNVAYAAARSNAQVEIANMLETQIAAAMQGKLDNAQQSGLNATSVDKYNQRIKEIVHESLTNSIPVMAVYRRLPNNSFEVQTRIAFDKKEISARLKRSLQNQLEMEGDQLNNLIDNVISTTL